MLPGAHAWCDAPELAMLTPAQDQRLIDAARQVERQYYRQVHLKYKELGGNPQADFNVGNVEMRMVELGLAEVFMEPWKGDARMQTRRRRKLNERQRASTAIKEEPQDPAQELSSYPQQPQQRQDAPTQAQAEYTTHHHHHYRQQLAAAQIDRSRYGLELPPQTQEQVLDEIDARGYPLDDGESDSDAKCDEIYGITTGSDGTLQLRLPSQAQNNRASKQTGGMGMPLS